MANNSVSAPDPSVGTPHWQPIETAPKDGRDVLVLHPSGDVCISYWGSIRGVEGLKSKLHQSMSGGEGDFCRDATHWMPLPDPPLLRSAQVSDQPPAVGTPHWLPIETYPNDTEASSPPGEIEKQAEITSLRAECEHWHSHYDAAQANWDEVLRQRAALLIDLRAILDEYNTKDGDLYRFVERIAARLSREPHQDTPQEFVNLRAEVVRLEQERDSLRSTIDQMDRVDAQYTTLLSDLQALVDQLSYQMSLTVFAREVKARLARENIS